MAAVRLSLLREYIFLVTYRMPPTRDVSDNAALAWSARLLLSTSLLVVAALPLAPPVSAAAAPATGQVAAPAPDGEGRDTTGADAGSSRRPSVTAASRS
jgi:hypothetical protein